MPRGSPSGRHGHLHAPRAEELIRLTWDNVHFRRDCTMHVERVKSGTPATHTLTGDEVRDLKRLQRESVPSRFVFCSERERGKVTTAKGRATSN